MLNNKTFKLNKFWLDYWSAKIDYIQLKVLHKYFEQV